MAPQRLSRLQRHIRALAHDKGNLSTSLKGVATKGLVTITRTPGGCACSKQWT